MKPFFLWILPLSCLTACTESEGETTEEPAQITDTVHSQIPLEDIPTEEEKFDSGPFQWYLNQRTAEDKLLTDIALEVNNDSKIDTVLFFTALGNWEIIKKPESRFESFPENTEVTVFSQVESAFFTIKEENTEKFIVLFGGIENGAAYAVIEIGSILIQPSGITSDINLPEEVETYTQYGLNL